MIENPRPTRAEASDVANAILDGTDAIMLSGETAAGRYPAETVETMARIARYTEVHYGLGAPERTFSGTGSQVARSLAHVAATVAQDLSAKLILVFTTSGATARLVSNQRPGAPIVGVTYLEDTFRRLALAWGVIPLRSPFVSNTDEMIVQGETLLKQRGLAQPGDLIIMLGGQSHTAGATNMLRVHIIG
jgi:pyruvate kinase